VAVIARMRTKVVDHSPSPDWRVITSFSPAQQLYQLMMMTMPGGERFELRRSSVAADTQYSNCNLISMNFDRL